MIGFIGQGYVGKNMADDFEERGIECVRYSLEKEYVKNREKIQECDIVFIAVPTPTKAGKQDLTALKEALIYVKTDAIAVIKSTVLPGTTLKLQMLFPRRRLLHSPEFLSEKSAREDVKKPFQNIIGHVGDIEATKKVQVLLPNVPTTVCTATTAELFKYTHNIHGVMRILFANVIYDLAEETGADYNTLADLMEVDPYMNEKAYVYNNPVQGGRGAGGNCFIKDLEAFTAFCEEQKTVNLLMRSLKNYNTELLLESGKDLDILRDCG